MTEKQPYDEEVPLKQEVLKRALEVIADHDWKPGFRNVSFGFGTTSIHRGMFIRGNNFDEIRILEEKIHKLRPIGNPREISHCIKIEEILHHTDMRGCAFRNLINFDILADTYNVSTEGNLENGSPTRPGIRSDIVGVSPVDQLQYTEALLNSKYWFS